MAVGEGQEGGPVKSERSGLAVQRPPLEHERENVNCWCDPEVIREGGYTLIVHYEVTWQ